MSLDFMRFPRGLMNPHRIRSDLRQTPHGLISHVAVNAPRVIDHFGIVRIETVQPHRNLAGVVPLVAPRIVAQQFQSNKPFHGRVRRMLKAFDQTGLGFRVVTQLGQTNRQQDVDLR